jgi:hypothetical protein
VPAPDFQSTFRLRARAVRRALGLSSALDAGAFAAGVAVAVGGATWAIGLGHAWAVAAAALGLGALAGVVHSRRTRWSDADVALYLDARLTHDEAISTALERHAASDEVTRDVTERALRVLTSEEAAAARPRVLRRRHALLPLAAAAVALLALAPPRPAAIAPRSAAPPVVAKLDGLTKVEALAKLAPSSDEERRRLEALAAAARRLREDAAAGIDRKEALDQAGRLRERLEAERKGLADAKNRAGLEAAIRALSKHEETEAAARALGRADLVALDEELELVAAKAEAESREIARQALAEAARAARERGAEEVARALEEQGRLLQRRAARSEAMEELSRLLGGALPRDEGRRLQTLDRGSPEAREALAKAMVDALRKLPEAERRKIAESLAKAAAGMQGGRATTREEMEKLAEALASPEGQKALEQALTELARGERSGQATRAQAMAMAELGLSQAERALSGQTGPAGQAGQAPRQAQGAESGNQPGQDGPGGPAAHGGETPEVSGKQLPAQARGPALGGVPVGLEGFSPARPGEARIAPATGALEAAAPGELSAMEGAFVPKEYRDQVGRYFAPK